MVPVPVVQVGPVTMVVFGGFVFMPMAMGDAAGSGFMGVRVVRIVVGVVVPMRKRNVTVGMVVLLAKEDYEGRDDDHGR
jgi:hypothetical protein